MPNLKLYDLAAADSNLRFSPFCWRTKMALAHKGLEVEIRPWRFVEKEVIDASGGKTAPVLDIDGKMISDSWQIALYLDETYQGEGQPPLMKSAQAQSSAQFLNNWASMSLMPTLFPLLLLNIYQNLDAGDQGYFLETRQKRFGKSFDEICSENNQAAAREAFAACVAPLEQTLKQFDFLGGNTPYYGDYAVFGPIMWADLMAKSPYRAEDGALASWVTRMRALHNGYAAAALEHRLR